MTLSSLTTQTERDDFRRIVQHWLDANLDAAPREQLDSIRAAMFRWKPESRTRANPDWSAA